MELKANHERHHDDAAYDEVRMWIQPRFKTSEMSGDEWRFSWIVQIARKGHIIREFHFGHSGQGVDSLRDALVWTTARLSSEHTPEEVERWKAVDALELCDNAACSNQAQVKFKRVRHGCGRCGHTEPCSHSWDHFSRWCLEHAIRGDASLDDSDDNYEQIDGPPLREARVSDDMISPATRVNVHTTLDTIGEDVAAAIDKFRSVD